MLAESRHGGQLNVEHKNIERYKCSTAAGCIRSAAFYRPFSHPEEPILRSDCIKVSGFFFFFFLRLTPRHQSSASWQPKLEKSMTKTSDAVAPTVSLSPASLVRKQGRRLSHSRWLVNTQRQAFIYKYNYFFSLQAEISLKYMMMKQWRAEAFWQITHLNKLRTLDYYLY